MAIDSGEFNAEDWILSYTTYITYLLFLCRQSRQRDTAGHRDDNNDDGHGQWAVPGRFDGQDRRRHRALLGHQHLDGVR